MCNIEKNKKEEKKMLHQETMDITHEDGRALTLRWLIFSGAWRVPLASRMH